MLQIRNGIFETNSSSSHALCILKEDRINENVTSWRVDSDGVLYFSDEDDLYFGRWPFEILSNWYDRLRYALASCACDPEMRGQITEICRKHIVGFKEFLFPINDWYDENEDEPECRYKYGGIDHQSDGLLQGFLSSHDVSMEEFIFNDRYLVIIDGDEYDYFDKLQATPAWNSEAVDYIVRA